MNILEEFENYMRKQCNISEDTIKLYKHDVEKYFLYVEDKYKEKKKYIYLLSRKKLILYRRYLKRIGYKILTINRILTAFTLYEQFLVETGRKKCKSNNFYYKEKERKNIGSISEESYELLLNMAKKESSRDYLMLLLFSKYKVSTRKLVKIRIKEDINFKEKTLELSNDKKIKINKELEGALRNYIRDRKKFLNGNSNQYLFISHISRNNGKPMDKSSMVLIIKTYFKRLTNSDKYYGEWSDIY